VNSSDKEINKWLLLRSELNSNYNYSENWKTAVLLFDERINNKYFNPVTKLVKLNAKTGEGFPIVIILCALIETFAAFKEGMIYNHSKPEIGGLSYEYNNSSSLFVKFLNTEQIFENIFYAFDKYGSRNNNVPFSASQFYTEVRCGLMHETRTKGKWIIRATKKLPENTVFIQRKKDGYIIFRNEFYYALKKYFDSYKNDLLNPDIGFNPLRRFFARKIDHLFDLKDNSEWWLS